MKSGDKRKASDLERSFLTGPNSKIFVCRVCFLF